MYSQFDALREVLNQDKGMLKLGATVNFTRKFLIEEIDKKIPFTRFSDGTIGSTATFDNYRRLLTVCGYLKDSDTRGKYILLKEIPENLTTAQLSKEAVIVRGHSQRGVELEPLQLSNLIHDLAEAGAEMWIGGDEDEEIDEIEYEDWKNDIEKQKLRKIFKGKSLVRVIDGGKGALGANDLIGIMVPNNGNPKTKYYKLTSPERMNSGYLNGGTGLEPGEAMFKTYDLQKKRFKYWGLCKGFKIAIV